MMNYDNVNNLIEKITKYFSKTNNKLVFIMYVKIFYKTIDNIS